MLSIIQRHNVLLYDQGAVMEKTNEQDLQTQKCNELQQGCSLCSAQSKMEKSRQNFSLSH